MTKLESILDSKSEDEMLKIFESSRSMIDLCRNKLGICDNTKNVSIIKNYMVTIGLDPQTYFIREKSPTYCLQCGKMLTKYQKKFCCYSCSNTYTNLHRETLKHKTKCTKCTKCGCDITIQVNMPLKYTLCENCKNSNNNIKSIKKPQRIPRIPIEKQCMCCGSKFYSKRSETKFCSAKCTTTYTSALKHEEDLKYYYDNQDEFIVVQDYKIKKFKTDFIKEQDGKCAICGIPQSWNDKHLIFILDHIDGDATNNARENLRCICPNCDSQLDTFKSKNRGSTRTNYFREKTIRLAKQQS